MIWYKYNRIYRKNRFNISNFGYEKPKQILVLRADKLLEFGPRIDGIRIVQQRDTLLGGQQRVDALIDHSLGLHFDHLEMLVEHLQ